MLIKSVEELLKLINKNHHTLFIFNLESLDIFKQLRFEEYIYRYITPNCINTAFLLLNHIHTSCSIIFGLSGNIKDIKDINYCRKNRIELIRRFTGGGTVLIDNNIITSSIIATHSFVPNLNPNNLNNWAFNFYKSTNLFNQYFNILNGDFTYNPLNHHTNGPNRIGQDTNGSDTIGEDRIGTGTVGASTVTEDTVMENIYNLEYKIGGNAQAYNKNSFVYHTSFIWEVSPRIEEILSIPKKIPKYRNNRQHNEFLKSIKNTLNINNKNLFIQLLIQSLSKLYHIILIHYSNTSTSNSINSYNSTNTSNSSDTVTDNFNELNMKELEIKYINDEIINNCINNKLFTNYINFYYIY
ncbi:lipoate protein ligase, putative [Theileria annulata]|uniref:Lipoate protein ligase, putative n=1 Tax=Theileria annulata TaxID=5874 RepID=Q4UCX5_THEAN|nr:lipoate protein ligase, putative [Theileria annulata]CAI75326.1 lipoate protein ligase, putative [Theileria annulata]|eukprot:XP_954802.1 lipoate protein ligase, putative [Theileria annulata]